MTSQHLKDLKGVMRGLYVIKQNANLLQRQRPIQNIRVLTQNQRDKFTKDAEILQFQQEMERQDEMHERELAEIEKREREKMEAEAMRQTQEVVKMKVEEKKQQAKPQE